MSEMQVSFVNEATGLFGNDIQIQIHSQITKGFSLGIFLNSIFSGSGTRTKANTVHPHYKD
jgi:hypothetical protein